MARVRGVARVCDGAFGVSDLDEDALWEAYAASVVAREVATEDDAAAPVEDVDVRDLTRGRRLADDRTLDVLDWPAVRALVARETTTDRATARANALVPHVDLDVVRLEQRATAEMRALATDCAIEIPRVREVGEPVSRAARGGLLGADELRDIGIALAAADAAVRRIRASDAPTLQARAAGASPLPEVAAAIDRAIGERGDVLDRASPALARIRRNAVHAQDDARDRCAAILRSPRYAKAIQDAIVTVRENRFVIPIKAEFAGSVPGVVHDTSSTGHTLFIEPLDALDVNNRLRTLRIEEEREVARILAELSALVGARAERAEANLEVLADIDLVLARVRVARRMDAVAPVVVDDARIDVRVGRHPLLGDRAIPQSLALDDGVRFIIISGPNMGGKTVALKLLGLFVTMTYCGMQLPAAEGTTVGSFGYLGCDIGDEQSIAENASTFSAHLRRLQTILRAAGPGSLVLVDEIASGTEPASSAALATAILERLLARDARGVVTTHSTELKLFASATAGVRNASVRFDPRTYAPTYELDLGSPGQSLAFPLARTLGIDRAIVARAETLLSTSERDYDRALADLANVRSGAAAERDALARERARLANLESTARERIDALDRERRKLASEADARLARALRDFTAELDRRNRDRPGGGGRAKVTSGQASLLGKVLDDVHRDLGIRAPAPTEPVAQAPRPVGVGDRVFVEALQSEGEVVEDFGDGFLVAIGAMKTVVPKRETRVVRRASAMPKRPRQSAGSGEATLDAATTASAELDVRGKRFVEAEPLVDKWIDESSLLGIPSLRLIHGKGTGLLGRGLQQWLKERGGIKSVRYGNAEEGGGGVTVFELG
ncbi:MAG: endonuclease MutS2 [Vulcanimicrobiaceae bacterium]